MEVNTDKTKIMRFRKGGGRSEKGEGIPGYLKKGWKESKIVKWS